MAAQVPAARGNAAQANPAQQVGLQQQAAPTAQQQAAPTAQQEAAPTAQQEAFGASGFTAQAGQGLFPATQAGQNLWAGQQQQQQVGRIAQQQSAVQAPPCKIPDLMPGAEPGDKLRDIVGTVEIRQPTFGIGGEVPPSGVFIRLAAPMEYKGQTLDTLHLDLNHASPLHPFRRGGALPTALQAGAAITVSGVFDHARWGGVETAGGTYALVDAVTVQGMEPATDGKAFFSPEGHQLPMKIITNDMLVDGISKLVVMHEGRPLFGQIGGMADEGEVYNGFRGFYKYAAPDAITAETQAEFAKVQESLVEVDRLETQGWPNETHSVTYADPKTDVVYRTDGDGVVKDVWR